MLGLLFRRVLIRINLFVTFNAHIFMNVTQKNLKNMKNNKSELIQVIIAYGLVALLFIIASHLEFLFNQ